MTSRVARNFLITGAARGIGRGLSRLLLEKGHRVYLVDLNEEELNHITSQLAQTHTHGQDFDSIVCNLRRPDEITKAVEGARKLFNGRLDVLVNNAAYTGGVGAAHLADVSLEEWNTSIETNLTGPFILSQKCIPLLEHNGSAESTAASARGSIIHVSSTRAIMSEPNNEAYSATKAGLLGLTQSMAVSLAPQGIRVNAILPGWINVTNESKNADESGQKWEDGLTADDHRWHLTGRVGKVDDILKAVEYLVQADFVSGTEMIVDGGVTRKMVYPE